MEEENKKVEEVKEEVATEEVKEEPVGDAGSITSEPVKDEVKEETVKKNSKLPIIILVVLLVVVLVCGIFIGNSLNSKDDKADTKTEEKDKKKDNKEEDKKEETKKEEKIEEETNKEEENKEENPEETKTDGKMVFTKDGIEEVKFWLGIDEVYPEHYFSSNAKVTGECYINNSTDTQPDYKLKDNCEETYEFSDIKDLNIVFKFTITNGKKALYYNNKQVEIGHYNLIKIDDTYYNIMLFYHL